MCTTDNIEETKCNTVDAVQLLKGFYQASQMIDDNINNMIKKQNEKSKMMKSNIEFDNGNNNNNGHNNVDRQESSFESNEMGVDTLNLDLSKQIVDDKVKEFLVNVIENSIDQSQDEEESENNSMKSFTISSDDTQFNIDHQLEALDGEIPL